MRQTIEGTYKAGVISLDRPPEGVTEARVVVEFVEPATPAGRRGGLTFGMFADPGGRRLTSDDDLDAVKATWNRDAE
jgi:hypothetical protein